MSEDKTILPGWSIVRQIGGGSFGNVYEIQKTEGEEVYASALKIISVPESPEVYRSYRENGHNEESVLRVFKKQVKQISEEYKLLSKFKGTTNIVSYEDHMVVPHADGYGWDILIRMELLQALPDYLEKREELSEAEIIKLGIDICTALALCARENIVHRDIKPQNIFINKFGDFKLGDFGIAKMMEESSIATKAGTFQYMAPEVYHGKAYGTSADIYSLGLVLYWLLNGRELPFTDIQPVIATDISNKGEAIARRMAGEDIPIPENGNNRLREIVLKACAFRVEDRFQSAEELKTALLCLSEPKEGNKPEDLQAQDSSILSPERTVLEDARTMMAEELTQIEVPSSISGLPEDGTAAGAMYSYHQQKYGEAYKRFQKLAEKNNALSQFMLAYLYERGLGTKKNRDRAVFWYKKAADQGDQRAQCAYALLIMETNDSAAYEEGLHYLGQSAGSGNLIAMQRYIDFCLSKGTGSLTAAQAMKYCDTLIQNTDGEFEKSKIENQKKDLSKVIKKDLKAKGTMFFPTVLSILGSILLICAAAYLFMGLHTGARFTYRILRVFPYVKKSWLLPIQIYWNWIGCYFSIDGLFGLQLTAFAVMLATASVSPKRHKIAKYIFNFAFSICIALFACHIVIWYRGGMLMGEYIGFQISGIIISLVLGVICGCIVGQLVKH